MRGGRAEYGRHVDWVKAPFAPRRIAVGTVRECWVALKRLTHSTGCAVLASLLCSLPANAADIAYGQYLSGECVTCHRTDGQDKGIPAIVGWPADQFVAVLKSYKDKDRPNAVMQTIAAKFSDDEMAALAAYYASLQPEK